MQSTEATHTHRRHAALGIGALFVATLFWSTGGVFGRKAAVGGVILSFWRMWIALVVMSIVMLVMRRPIRWAHIRGGAVMGVMFGFNICAFFISLEYIPVAVALIIGALTPVIAFPVAVLVMGERMNATKVWCALVAVVGVVCAVLTAPASKSSGNSAVGYVWAVLSLVVWVGYLLMSKQARRTVGTLELMWVMAFLGSITVSAIVLFTRAHVGQMHGTGWVWVTLLTLGPGLMGHGLFAWAQPRVEASVSSVLIQLEPVLASIIAWLMLGQRVSLLQALSMAVVVAALSVLAWAETRERPTAEPLPPNAP
jgi:drug/metabolite transporter (DMT)-like permease